MCAVMHQTDHSSSEAGVASSHTDDGHAIGIPDHVELTMADNPPVGVMRFAILGATLAWTRYVCTTAERKGESMFRRRRPLMRAAVVGGVAYHAGKKVQQGREQDAEQDARLDDVEDAQAAPAPAAGLTEDAMNQ